MQIQLLNVLFLLIYLIHAEDRFSKPVNTKIFMLILTNFIYNTILEYCNQLLLANKKVKTIRIILLCFLIQKKHSLSLFSCFQVASSTTKTRSTKIKIVGRSWMSETRSIFIFIQRGKFISCFQNYFNNSTASCIHSDTTLKKQTCLTR